MKAVILVGGEGTRLRPLTCNLPKPMVPVVNRPFLEHTIEYLKRHRIEDIILAMGYLPGRIQEHFGDGSKLGVKLTYVVEASPLGTAGAVKNLAQHLDDKPFLVFNGDMFTDIDLTRVVSFHRRRGAVATIVLTRVDDPTRYGTVEADAKGRVRRFIEKPGWDAVTSFMINAGTYVLNPAVLDYIPDNTYFMFEQGVFQALLSEGRPVYSYPSNAYWIDLGTPEHYLQLHYDLLQGKSTRFSLAAGTGTIQVGEGSVLHSSAQITGSVLIGNNCTVSSGVKLIGPCVIGSDCYLGEGAIVEGSVVWGGTRIGVGARLKNCIVAYGCLVGDRCSVSQGCVLGDKVSLGDSSSLETGVKVWPEAQVEPGGCLTGV